LFNAVHGERPRLIANGGVDVVLPHGVVGGGLPGLDAEFKEIEDGGGVGCAKYEGHKSAEEVFFMGFLCCCC
jgi:hypothetical protein